MYSYKVEQAIRAATILHQDQLRMGAVPLPYISHLIAVALILSDYTDDEDTDDGVKNAIAAAILSVESDDLLDGDSSFCEYDAEVGISLSDGDEKVPETPSNAKYYDDDEVPGTQFQQTQASTCVVVDSQETCSPDSGDYLL